MNDEKRIARIVNDKDYNSPSVFLPENLLREARRQKGLSQCSVPEICVLDPDGDFADFFLEKGKAKKNDCWACYHSISLILYELMIMKSVSLHELSGSSYAVLVAEQLFVSGCKYLISVTSAGIIIPPSSNKRFALIIHAIRDEGTSYHYLPEDRDSTIRTDVLEKLDQHCEDDNCPWFHATSWTTDAPYRETEKAISAMKKERVTCVEMEAAGLYAFAQAANKNVICFAHLHKYHGTN
ncbi:MAG: nucleoside phosphorylase [Cyclobacteriaceae bacterium]|nr:nucleoside phosphorylase [Cyclobacteriaceae bacterium]